MISQLPTPLHRLHQTKSFHLPSSIDCITNYTANADLSLQDHEWNKLNRPNNRITTHPISGDEVIGNLLHNQMILTPVAINAHGRFGPMTRQNLYGTPPPDIPPRKQFKPNRPNAKAMYNRTTTYPAPIGIFIEADQRWKQLQSDNPHHSQKFYGLSHYAPTPSMTTIQQLGLGITHASALSYQLLQKNLSILRYQLPLITTTDVITIDALNLFCEGIFCEVF